MGFQCKLFVNSQQSKIDIINWEHHKGCPLQNEIEIRVYLRVRGKINKMRYEYHEREEHKLSQEPSRCTMFFFIPC